MNHKHEKPGPGSSSLSLLRIRKLMLMEQTAELSDDELLTGGQPQLPLQEEYITIWNDRESAKAAAELLIDHHNTLLASPSGFSSSNTTTTNPTATPPSSPLHTARAPTATSPPPQQPQQSQQEQHSPVVKRAGSDGSLQRGIIVRKGSKVRFDLHQRAVTGSRDSPSTTPPLRHSTPNFTTTTTTTPTSPTTTTRMSTPLDLAREAGDLLWRGLITYIIRLRATESATRQEQIRRFFKNIKPLWQFMIGYNV